MVRKLLASFWLSLLILLCISASSVQAYSTMLIEPPTLLNIDGIPVTSAIPRTTNQAPTFVGRCTFPFANMDYEMRTPPILGTGRADETGLWQWTVPQKLDYGLHTLYVVATNPNDSTNTETNVFRIEVVPGTAVIVRWGLVLVLGIAILSVIGFIISKKFKKFKKPRKKE